MSYETDFTVFQAAVENWDLEMVNMASVTRVLWHLQYNNNSLSHLTLHGLPLI